MKRQRLIFRWQQTSFLGIQKSYQKQTTVLSNGVKAKNQSSNFIDLLASDDNELNFYDIDPITQH